MQCTVTDWFKKPWPMLVQLVLGPVRMLTPLPVKRLGCFSLVRGCWMQLIAGLTVTAVAGAPDTTDTPTSITTPASNAFRRLLTLSPFGGRCSYHIDEHNLFVWADALIVRGSAIDQARTAYR